MNTTVILPEMPVRIQRLPKDSRGYPVPFFVVWLDADGKACKRGEGTPEFRVADGRALKACIEQKLCWVCGERMGQYSTFTIGPMCALNRTSAEPPAHKECAIFSAKACPFLTRPKQKRNPKDLPEDRAVPPGHMIERNPGVTLVWITKNYGIFRDPQGGLLFDIGDPTELFWLCQGRQATREEVLESIDSGLPLLENVCEGPADLLELKARYARALALLPAA